MSEKLVLSIDQGTTSTRAILFNKNGDLLFESQKDLSLVTPQSGWVEQDANQIWEDVVAVCHDVLAKVDIDDVVGIGITNQRETTIIWDKNTGEPVYNAIVWQDRRTADFCKKLKPYEDDIQARTGLLADPYFSATKIRWILDNIDQNDNLIFGTIDCYLLWKLTGGKTHATDASNASRTMLFNIHDQQWDKVQCDRLNIPMNMLPNVVDNIGDHGVTDLFEKPLPILAMAGDQQAATFGQNCFKPGMVKATYGTGCFVLMNTGDDCIKSENKLLSTVAWRINGKVTYALEGSIFVAGAAVQFLRDNLHFFKKAKESSDLAMSVKDTDGIVFVPSFTGLGAPYWKPDVRGAIFGLSRGTTQAHITRAVLDAQSFQTRDLVSAMENDTDKSMNVIRVDGGLVANDYVCQMIANQTDVEIDRPVNTEATAWGVAAMVFLNVGIFKSLDDIEKTYVIDKKFKPLDNVTNKNKLYDQWKRAVKAVQYF